MTKVRDTKVVHAESFVKNLNENYKKNENRVTSKLSEHELQKLDVTVSRENREK